MPLKFSNRMETLSNSTEHLAYDASLEKKWFNMDTILWKIVLLFSALMSLIAFIVGIVAEIRINNISLSTQAMTYGYPRSCLEIKDKSGVYTIQPNSQSQPFMTYCDMESNGGGWTLIASIHENNIKGKCTPGDRWSSDQGAQGKSLGAGNWENRNIFGSIETITDDDYKNPAYYSLPASDVMLWHVPNGKKAYEISGSAKLKYYTYNKFLNKSTLRDFYANKLPLKIAVGGLEPLLSSIKTNSKSISSMIPDWYDYVYDGGPTNSYIRDGGGDMYDGGNKVYFATDRENFTQLVYDTPFFLYGSGVEVKSAKTHPFVSFAWVGKGLGSTVSNITYFDFKVVSNFGADGRGKQITYNNKQISQGSMTAQYTAFNIANSSDPSISEVYFYISSTKWKSKSPVMEKVNWSNGTGLGNNQVRFKNSPYNVLIGYTLLSKQFSKLVSSKEIEDILKKYMSMAENFTFVSTVPRYVAPVKYAKGNHSVVISGIPSLHRERVEAGYIHFRAYNSVGMPNALCPGVKVNSDNPEQMCIGGASTAVRDIKQCGDFAGWEGAPNDSGSQSSPSKTGKSLDDINSSILIFTR